MPPSFPLGPIKREWVRAGKVDARAYPAPPDRIRHNVLPGVTPADAVAAGTLRDE